MRMRLAVEICAAGSIETLDAVAAVRDHRLVAVWTGRAYSVAAANCALASAGLTHKRILAYTHSKPTHAPSRYVGVRLLDRKRTHQYTTPSTTTNAPPMSMYEVDVSPEPPPFVSPVLADERHCSVQKQLFAPSHSPVKSAGLLCRHAVHTASSGAQNVLFCCASAKADVFPLRSTHLPFVSTMHSCAPVNCMGVGERSSRHQRLPRQHHQQQGKGLSRTRTHLGVAAEVPDLIVHAVKARARLDGVRPAAPVEAAGPARDRRGLHHRSSQQFSTGTCVTSSKLLVKKPAGSL